MKFKNLNQKDVQNSAQMALTGSRPNSSESSVPREDDSTHTSIPGRKMQEQSDIVAFLDLTRTSAEGAFSIDIWWLSMKCMVIAPDSIFMTSTACHEP